MNKTILVVDNDAKARSTCQMELESEGYRVLTATNCMEALDYVSRDTFDVIVLEPEGLTLDYLSEFLKVDRHLKVVINSDHPELKMDFHTWLADAFLIKSSDLTDLKSTVFNLVYEKSLN